MIYTEDNRGKIHIRERACQVIDYSGLKYDRITPTDIDGVLEVGDKVRIFYEYKSGYVDMPRGQELALTRIVDDLNNQGKTTILLLCRHNTPPEKDINGAESIVEKIYHKGKWSPGDNRTAKDITDTVLKNLGLLNKSA